MISPGLAGGSLESASTAEVSFGAASSSASVVTPSAPGTGTKLTSAVSSGRSARTRRPWTAVGAARTACGCPSREDVPDLSGLLVEYNGTETRPAEAHARSVSGPLGKVGRQDGDAVPGRETQVDEAGGESRTSAPSSA